MTVTLPARSVHPTSKPVISHSCPTKEKYVYAFGNGTADGNASMRFLLGGKGAGLAEMSRIGLPVPPGFTITTEVCTWFNKHLATYPLGLQEDVGHAICSVESLTGMRFGDATAPLLVSVRSGARASMPGMMDTILNIGINDNTVQGLARMSADPRFAYDCYRRFIQMFADIVMGIDHDTFEHILSHHKERLGVPHDSEISSDDWMQIIADYKTEIRTQTGKDFPQDPQIQLWDAIGAVFRSWSNDRAITYRKLNDIPHDWGTAVTVQAMVFGNMGGVSATGVAFTRNPATGENELFGEYLINAQGEDIVAGIRTPQQIAVAGKQAQLSDLPAMEECMPELFGQLNGVRHTLEEHYRDMQDIEFTVQRGKLHILQTRAGKRTAHASIKVACDMVEEGLITKEEAILRVDPGSLNQLLHPRLDPKARRDILARGLPASPGAASGRIVLSSEKAKELADCGEPVILCRAETSPEDIHGMHIAEAIVTMRGGMTSHAAVVARGMGRPCVVGASELVVDYETRVLRVGEKEIEEGEFVTVDGGSGELLSGRVATISPELSGDFGKLMSWADERRKMEVMANADTPEDCRTAIKFGAEGVGLCRTEHMFFSEDRIAAVREMILAKDDEGRRAALQKVVPMQRGDFVEIFKIMGKRPVTIRLLDPPLHEFLPHHDAEFEELALSTGCTASEIRERASKMAEANPMLGHRGCRVGVTYPEIYEMQARAILEAAASVGQKEGRLVCAEIMVPFVVMESELRMIKDAIDKVAEEVVGSKTGLVKYRVGTMIELPRAALAAGKIAKEAEFFSFGTNDLTQTVMGISRDDVGSFLPKYQELGLLQQDPFVTLDQEGVGEMVKIAVQRGKKTRPDIGLCLCGEQGGDPASVAFCHEAGLSSVSCSPYRVPIARLSAAHAALGESG